MTASAAGGLAFSLAYVRDGPGTLRRLAERGPAPQPLRVAGVRMLLVHDPSDVADLLARDAAGLPKAGMGRAETLIGQGLLTSHGAHHDRQRRLAEAAFGPAVMAGLDDVLRDETARLLAEWRPGAPLDAFRGLRLLAARIIARAVLGDLGDDALSAVAGDLEIELAWLNRYPEPLRLLDRLPLPWRRSMRAARSRLRARAVEAWRGGRGGPVLASIRAAREPDGAGMADEAALDEVLTFLIAGHEPVAVALAWALWRLGQHRDWQGRLADEADRAAPSAGSPAPLADAFLRETLRLHPPIWLFARRAPTAMAIGGVAATPGTWLLVSPLVTQRAGVYAVPDAFDPMRWAAGWDAPPGAYLPFGWGPRRCIGEPLALRLGRLFLGELVRSETVAPAGGDAPPPQEATITLRPRRGLWVTIAERRTPPRAV